MQDRFKFRAWDIIQARMHNYWDADSELKDGVFYLDMIRNDELKFQIASTNIYNEQSFEPEYFDAKNFIILQCIGLEDREGTLIYEGDLVVHHLCLNVKYKPIGCVVWDKSSSAFVIRFRDGSIQKLGFSTDWNEFKIIGNKFQNPELLQEVEG